MANFMQKFLLKLVGQEKGVEKLTLSFCVGNFIAWLPIVPLQTPAIFIISWLFKLNTAVVFTTVYVIANPFTLIFIYIAGYAFGKWLFNLLNLNLTQYNPLWVETFSNYISKYINLNKMLGKSQFCFWCLIIGGFILSCILSVLLYPVMKRIFGRLLKRVSANESNISK